MGGTKIEMESEGDGDGVRKRWVESGNIVRWIQREGVSGWILREREREREKTTTWKLIIKEISVRRDKEGGF